MRNDKATLYAHRVWYINRYIAPMLNSYERHVLMWITDRTISFNKMSDIIPMKHFVEGISWDGKVQIPPVNMPDKTLRRAIDGLVAKGILRKEGRAGDPRTCYTLLLKGLIFNVGWPDQDDKSSVTQTKDLGHTDQAYINRDYNNNSHNVRARAHETSDTLESVTMDPMDSVRSAIAGATAKTKTQQAKKQAKGNASAYQSLWQAAHQSSYPEDRWFPWTIAKAAAFKKALDRGIPVHDRPAFIAFVVSRWSDIIAAQFPWMRNPQDFPSVEFVTKHVQKFWQAFEEDRDPNRRLKRRVGDNVSTPAPVAAKPDTATAERIKELEQANAQLQARNKALAQEKVVTRRKLTLRRVTRPRNAKPDAEFGQWIDKD